MEQMDKRPSCLDGQYYQVERMPEQIPRKHFGLPAVLGVGAVLLCCLIVLALQTRLFNVRTVRFEARAEEPAAESVPQITLQPSAERDETVSAAETALSLQEIYKKAIPSVVSITTDAGSGTGIVLTEDGYLITNSHVIENAAQIAVLLTDDTRYTAEVVGSDEVSDLAVLKIDAAGLTPAEFGSSESLEVGDQVVAIGDPLGVELRGTMTDGIISAINRNIETGGRVLTLLQTNAALNEGNSGGPLLNAEGQVIGINTMKLFSASSGIEGIGFAIPISVAQPILQELLEQGYVSGRPSLGFSGVSVPLRAQLYYGWPSGVYLQEVDEDSDAYARGIRAGDIIVQLDGETVTSYETLDELKNHYEAGDTVTLLLFRGGAYYRVEIVLGEQT